MQMDERGTDGMAGISWGSGREGGYKARGRWIGERRVGSEESGGGAMGQMSRKWSSRCNSKWCNWEC